MLVGGVVVTLLLAPWSLLLLFVAVAGSALGSGDGWTVLWGISGILGVTGYWMWFFSKRPLPLKRRIVVTVFLCAGIGAISPYLRDLLTPDWRVVLQTPWRLVVVAAAIMVVVVVGSVWLPNNALESDRET